MFIKHTKISLPKKITNATIYATSKKFLVVLHKLIKRLVSKAVFLPQFPPPSVLATAVTPSSRDVQPEADVDILKYQRIRLEINLFLQ